MKCLKLFVLFLFLPLLFGCSTTSASKVLYESAKEELATTVTIVKTLPEVCKPQELDEHLFNAQKALSLYRDYQESQISACESKNARISFINYILFGALVLLAVLFIKK